MSELAREGKLKCLLLQNKFLASLLHTSIGGAKLLSATSLLYSSILELSD